MSERRRIIVSGLAALYPLGGVAWDYLQYVVGLHRLGHDVVYHEDTWGWPYHPLEGDRTDDGTYSARSLAAFFERYAPALRDRWHYRHLHETSFGMDLPAFEAFARSADLYLNVSGANPIPEALAPDAVSVFLDTDPGYNQIVYLERPAWSANVDRWCATVDDHDRHATYGELVGAGRSAVPPTPFDWVPTRMPVVLDLWDDVPPPPPGAPWTTVMTWNAFAGPLTYRGAEFGSKGREFGKIEGLPRAHGGAFRLALGGVGAPVARVESAGWEVVDGPHATITPGAYRDFIAGSRGEVSTAKHVYVALRTGWASCRTACYLAAGRPAVVQDTGFSDVLETGRGLLAFDDADGAAEAVRAVEADYAAHAAAARDVAREAFGAGAVLTRLLRDVGV